MEQLVKCRSSLQSIRIPLTNEQILRLKKVEAIVKHLDQRPRTPMLKLSIVFGKSCDSRYLASQSVNRVVTCDYGDTEWATPRKERQRYLLTIGPVNK